MADFQLGFSIDTSSLKEAADAGTAAAEAIGKLGEAQAKQSTSSKQQTEAQARANEESNRAAENGTRLIAALEMEARATNDFAKSQRVLDESFINNRITLEQHTQGMAAATGTLGVAKKGAQEYASGTKNEVKSLGEQLANFSGQLRLNQQDVMSLANAFTGQGGTGLVSSVGNAGGAFARLTGALGPAGIATVAIGAGVAALAVGYWELTKKVGAYQDQDARLEARLKNSLGTTGAARDAMESLFEATQKTGLGVESANQAFARLAQSNSSIGLTRDEMLKMVDTMQKLGVVSGASASEVDSGMFQFTRALSMGQLQGRQLQQLLMTMPALVKIIADNWEGVDGKIGVSQASLKKMGAAGELSAQKVTEAFMRGSDQVNTMFDGMPQSMQQANTKVEDQWHRTLAKMGEALKSSELYQFFKNYVNDRGAALEYAITGGTKQQQLKTAQDELQALQKQLHSQSGQIYSYGMGGGNTSDILKARIAAKQRQVGTLNTEVLKGAKEEAASTEPEAVNKLIAWSQGGLNATEGLESYKEKLQKAKAVVTKTDETIAQLEAAIALGGTPQKSTESLREDLATVTKRRGIALAEYSQKLSEYGKVAQTVHDGEKARAAGGTAGGAAIYMQSITAQRADALTGTALQLDAYTKKFATAQAQSSQSDIDKLEAEIAASQLALAAVGKSRQDIMEADLQTSLAAEAAGFGTYGRSVEAASVFLGKFEARAREAAATAESLRVRGILDTSKTGAANAASLAAAGQSPLDQQRAQFEISIREGRKGLGNPAEAAAWEKTQRAANASASSQTESGAQLAQGNRLKALERERTLVGLTSDQYELQNALLGKQAELESKGYEQADAFYKAEMKRTAEYEKRVIDQRKATAQANAIFSALYKGVDSFQNAFESAFDETMTYGAKRGAEVFGHAMGDIIKKISDEMVYAIAIKPFEELARQLATSLGKWIVGMLGGGAPSGDTYSLNQTPNTNTAARGASFSGGAANFSRFAAGGSFTNSIVDRPTLFRFASGTGLMGEAGPEAIMPLKRDASGRLGVSGGGGDSGGIQVVVNDMRTSKDSQPVQTSESKGPDGKRVLSLLVRDEMRRQMRSGDMDREMQGNYGTNRVLTRM